MKSDPRQVAANSVDEIIAEGLKKHLAEGWRTENIRMHCLKAQRHLSTFMLMLDKYQRQDGEDHLKLALTRTAMALTQLVDAEKRGRE